MADQEFDYDEYEDDVEDNDDINENGSEIDYGNFEDDNIDEPLYSNHDDIINKKEIERERNNYEPEENIDIELEEEIDDDDNENEEDDNYDEQDNIIIKKTQIQIYKTENIEKFSIIGMQAYLCELVDYIKKGGMILDGRTDFDYPTKETEESYAIESILLDTTPFAYLVNNKEITLTQKTRMICLKLVLRCVDDNKTIFFTNHFVNTFPTFVKCLFNNYITNEEYKEIEKAKNNLKLNFSKSIN